MKEKNEVVVGHDQARDQGAEGDDAFRRQSGVAEQRPILRARPGAARRIVKQNDCSVRIVAGTGTGTGGAANAVGDWGVEARGNLEARLENWGTMRRNGTGSTQDAMHIQAAWLRLDPIRRELLQMKYVWRANREVICRRLKIRRVPSTVLDLELAAAYRAVESALNKLDQAGGV
ncbi:hypothetical protein [Burkholderia pyrrocinia]|uniref:hypothetical protein n=1 Tax=Burkholderia pyrrocinia TaxID=60550 RepID=UPI001BCD3E9F|nr:hypothetical protein [Burkholderia pyrrocinia]QVN18969.1 hypothetical protein JYG32_04315 [Burkholderia pyrrocinia]